MGIEQAQGIFIVEGHLSVAALCAGVSIACSVIMLAAMAESAVIQIVAFAAAAVIVVLYLLSPALVSRGRARSGSA